MSPDPDGDLLQQYLDGRLSPEQTTALEARLKTEPVLAEQLLALAQEEATLREWAQARWVAAATQRAWIHRRVARSVPRADRRRPRWLVRLVLLTGVAAATAWFTFTWLVPGSPPAQATTLAQLTEAQGKVRLVMPDGNVRDARGGEALRAGQEVRTSGEGSQAAIRYADGTRLELSPDTVVRLEGGSEAGVGKSLYLQAGLVEANVTRQPEDRPLVLRTPQAIIRVLGTRFSSAASVEATRVELEKGRVQVTRMDDGQSVIIEEGRFAVVTPLDGPLVAQPLPLRLNQPGTALPEQPGPVPALTFAPDGRTLAVAGWDGTVTLWDQHEGNTRLSWKAFKHGVRTLAFSPDGTVLAAGSQDKVIKYWDAATGQPLAVTFPKQKGDVNLLAFSPDGRLLASALGIPHGRKGAEQVVLWDARTGREVARLVGHAAIISALAFAPDGRTLATAAKDGSIKLWDLDTRTERLVLWEHNRGVSALAYSADGRRLASAGQDQVIRIWDVPSGEVRQVLGGHPHEVRALAFSRTGLLASGGWDSLVRLWDPAIGRELCDLKGHRKGPIPALAFSPDGRLLATGGWDRRVLIWDVPGQEQGPRER